MKEANIFLLDLNPSANVGCTLRDIIKSCTKLNVDVQYESSGKGKSVPCGRDLTNTIVDCQLDLVIFVLSSCNL